MKYILTLLGFLVQYSIFACDFCGCFMGITPYDNQSSISVLYRYKSYSGYYGAGQGSLLFPNTHRSYHPNRGQDFSDKQLKHGSHTVISDSALSPRDYELFTSAELRGKFFIHPRIELNAVIPFVMNQNRVNEQKQTIQGLGDMTFFAAYHVVSKIMTEKYQHRLILGAGLKLPVGDYYQKDASNNRIDYMLQPGTGSVDYLAYLNYVFGVKKFGLNFNTMFKYNGENYYHERVDNSTATYLNVFYKFRQEKDLKFFPSIQGFYEYTKGVYIHETFQNGTTMNVLTAGVGLDVFYKNMTLNTSFHLPAYEQGFDKNLKHSAKFMVGLTYNFNQKKYLLRRKQTE
ncbi:MAG: hypothetical protein J0L87_00295 [Bacteroidetes bacterium]|nr:hypothetical protein [Bacteroidota bacterium]